MMELDESEDINEVISYCHKLCTSHVDESKAFDGLRMIAFKNAIDINIQEFGAAIVVFQCSRSISKENSCLFSSD